MAVFGFVYGIVLSGVISYFTVVGFDIDKSRWLHMTARFLAPLLILPAIRWVLHVKWSDFRIALIHEEESAAPASAKETNVAGV
jgi:hypothetical protein